MSRITKHPVLEDEELKDSIEITVDGKAISGYRGEMIAAVLIANGIKSFRYTKHRHEPRGIYCGIGRCTDCAMTVNGIPNIRTCVTEIEEGMVVETQYGVGSWKRGDTDDSL